MKKSLTSVIRAPRRNSILNLTLLPMLLALITGCPSGNPTGGSSTAGKIVIKGSNTIGEELAPRLIAEYKKKHPDVLFETEFKGTAYGFGNILSGTCDFAAASREPNQTEKDIANSRNIDLQEHVIGSYGVTVVVNARSAVSNLTEKLVGEIFSGSITNWKELGGDDAAIELYGRDPISGTHLGFKETAMRNMNYGAHFQALTSYKAIVDAVGRHPHAIGYSDFSPVDSKNARVITISGVQPNPEEIKSGKYPFVRTLRLYTRKGNTESEVLKFLEFLKSAPGQKIIREMGFAPTSQ